ncbi:DUF4249 domain-containing protein [Tenacibaculum sp. M341]|uniref:DUF4249 domain-containing protein n=1 Tax=Tenacibaculum sp. M341 TaxID=2530339 RepID=UPI001048282B|nr:DUF4249 domain-containing protein [Tenacibaculum sp. M341]TCI95024.1 DUF4249 domain-containing protein [Tenacibaculum sp. M341]
MKRNTLHILFFLIMVLNNSCVEPFENENIAFDDLLVVEARITNENKHHIIKLSRTIQIDSINNIPEKQSIVCVIDEAQNVYNFSEISEGIYKSDVTFEAALGKKYKLNIKTKDKGEFTSTFESITGVSEIKNINYSIEENNLKEEIIQISLDSKSLEKNARYYLFEYEETYKLVAPYWTPFELELVPYPPENILVKSDQGGHVCYKTDFSNKIIQSETQSLSEGDLKGFVVRSISTQNYIVAHRYSILIKQYVQSLEAYSFYQALKRFSESEGIFLENQVGFIQGNITSENDDNRQVIGFFEVSSVSEKRIFFNSEDLNIDVINNYPEECILVTPAVLSGDGESKPLLNALSNGYQYWDLNSNVSDTMPGPYYVVNDSCADCRFVGEAEKPDFWID